MADRASSVGRCGQCVGRKPLARAAGYAWGVKPPYGSLLPKGKGAAIGAFPCPSGQISLKRFFPRVTLRLPSASSAPPVVTSLGPAGALKPRRVGEVLNRSNHNPFASMIANPPLLRRCGEKAPTGNAVKDLSADDADGTDEEYEQPKRLNSRRLWMLF